MLRANAAAALAAALIACGAEPPPGPGSQFPRVPPPERIVLIVVDTLRRDHVSAYGSEVQTPHIDALAARGQIFPGAVGSFHQTTMSMASLFTGRTPSLETDPELAALEWTGETWCGLRRHATADDPNRCIPSRLPTLAGALREAGYWTVGIASNRLTFRPAGYDRGFDRWFEISDSKFFMAPDLSHRGADVVNLATVRALSERPTDRFFLYVHYMDAHDYGFAAVPYAEGVRAADTGIGKLLHWLEEQALLEGAVVFVTADHGERLGDVHWTSGGRAHNGNPSFEEVLQVPLVVAPAVFPGTSLPVRSDDTHRLILRLAGIEQEPSPELAAGELFVSERRYQTLRRGRWKLHRRRSDGELSLMDLERDPGETREVSTEHRKVAEELAARIDALAASLATRGAAASELTEEDRARLRALGYAE